MKFGIEKSTLNIARRTSF